MIRRAFTLLELLIVIGVIAALAALLLLGMRSVQNNARTNETKIILQTLQGMLSELDAKTQLGKSPQAWTWWGLNSPSTLEPAPADPLSSTYDFWHLPASVNRTGVVTPDSLDAPGQVGADTTATRNGSRQILNTQIVMSMLLSLPANRTALQKIQADRYFTPTWVGNQQVPTPGTDGVLNTSDDGSEAVADFYLPGMIVQLNGIQYLCNSTSAPPVATPPSPHSPGPPWRDLTQFPGTPQVPLLLDAWDNPIIFVPATGLRVRLLNGQSSNTTTDPTQTFIIISPEGKVQSADSTHPSPFVIQPGRPFFASAGPDGDFSKGDDNIYSFQQ